MMAGVDMVHVPCRGGGNVLSDLITGQVQVSFIAPDVAMEHVKADKLRLLAVTFAGRWEAAPNVPTVAELLPGYEKFCLVRDRNSKRHAAGNRRSPQPGN